MRTRLALLMLAATLASPALAQRPAPADSAGPTAAAPTEAAPETPASPYGGFAAGGGKESGGSTGRLLMALAFVALAAAAAWWLRRRRGPGRRGRLEVVESVSIGPKRSLLVVSYGGRALLLGSTEQGVTVLHEGAAPEPEPALEEEPSFESLLSDSIEDRDLRLKLRAAVAGGGV